MIVGAGDQFVMIASKDATVVASDGRTAEKLSDALRELDKEVKYRAIEEWAKLVEEAGLAGLRAKDIDRLVNEGVHREVFGRERKGNSR